jgi:flagellar protein FlgJ
LGEKGNDALARYKQLQGQAFLQAYNLLKGGGAITDIEGKKAESAMARLDRAQSEDTFKEALKDFRDAIESGITKLKAKAGAGPVAPAASAPTNLKAKYGLD